MTDDANATRLGAALIPTGEVDDLTHNDVTSYRAVTNQRGTADKLGPLKDLPGFWEGTGFSLIARPDFGEDSDNGFFLELNWLRETIEFTTIGSPVFNRGSKQGDIQIYGLTYLHRVTDGTTGGALHIEPGLWLNIPATSEPKADASIARLFSIPHGNAVNTVGLADEIDPATFEIPKANTVPFAIGGEAPPPGTKNPYPEFNLAIDSLFRSTPLPAGLTQDLIDDPNTFGRNAIRGQTLEKVVRLITATRPAGGIENIPFITTNADNKVCHSAFIIQTVRGQTGEDFLQLQYSQTALINFAGKSWPHVTVGTLIKAF